jgi:hypothetical protein
MLVRRRTVIGAPVAPRDMAAKARAKISSLDMPSQYVTVSRVVFVMTLSRALNNELKTREASRSRNPGDVNEVFVSSAQRQRLESTLAKLDMVRTQWVMIAPLVDKEIVEVILERASITGANVTSRLKSRLERLESHVIPAEGERQTMGIQCISPEKVVTSTLSVTSRADDAQPHRRFRRQR